MKKKKPIFPMKATIILDLHNGVFIAGKGMVEALKNSAGEFVFTATLVKDYSKKKKRLSTKSTQ